MSTSHVTMLNWAIYIVSYLGSFLPCVEEEPGDEAKVYVLVTAPSVMYPQPRSTVVRLLNMVPLRWVIISELITGAPPALQSYCKYSVCVCTRSFFNACVSFIPRQPFFFHLPCSQASFPVHGYYQGHPSITLLLISGTSPHFSLSPCVQCTW